MQRKDGAKARYRAKARKVRDKAVAMAREGPR
jgi:hypothetical protein